MSAIARSPRRRRVGSAGFARRFRPKDAPKRRRRRRRSGVEQWIWGSRAARRSSARRAAGSARPARRALAEAGCAVTINGRDAARLAETAKEIRAATGAEVVAVPGDLDDPAVRDALFAACPEPDILVNNNGGPPPTAFADLTREMILAGLEANMLTPIALIQRALPGMAARRFGRIVNITSSSVRAPIPGLDVSSGARAGLTAFVAASARAYAKHNVTINSIQPGAFDTDRIRVTLAKAAASGEDATAAARAARGRDPRRPLRPAGGIRRAVRLPRQRLGRLRHRPEHPDRRRRLPGSVLNQSDAPRDPAQDRRDLRLRGDVGHHQVRLGAFSGRRDRAVPFDLRHGDAGRLAGAARRVPACAAHPPQARPHRPLDRRLGRHVRQFHRAVAAAARRRDRLHLRLAAVGRADGGAGARRDRSALPLGGGRHRLRRRADHAVRRPRAGGRRRRRRPDIRSARRWRSAGALLLGGGDDPDPAADALGGDRGDRLLFLDRDRRRSAPSCSSSPPSGRPARPAPTSSPARDSSRPTRSNSACWRRSACSAGRGRS